jgi:hypothetical protein
MNRYLTLGSIKVPSCSDDCRLVAASGRGDLPYCLMLRGKMYLLSDEVAGRLISELGELIRLRAKKTNGVIAGMTAIDAVMDEPEKFLVYPTASNFGRVSGGLKEALDDWLLETGIVFASVVHLARVINDGSLGLCVAVDFSDMRPCIDNLYLLPTNRRCVL